MVEDAQLASANTDTHVFEFVQANLSSLDKIVEFCLGIANKTASIDRFVGTSLSDLAQQMKDMYH